ncbi:uncharacterized protein [Anabrus simplex]
MLVTMVAFAGAQYHGGPPVYEQQQQQPQYEVEQYQEPQEYQQPRPRSFQQPRAYQPPEQSLPIPAILMHKQALSTDGAFNYAFSADNGLKQGETIAPDGSRQGQYSYVDPTGNTIKVRYVADKNGFRVIEGDHLPQPPSVPAPAAPQYSAPRPAPAYRPPQQTYSPPPQAYSPPPQQAYSAPPSPPPQAYNPPPQAYNPPPPPPPPQYRAEPAPQYQSPRSPTLTSLGGQQGPQVFQSTAPATFPQAQPQRYNAGPRQAEKEPHSFGGGYAFEFGG